MAEKLTKAQRRVVQFVADNPGRLYGSRRDFPPSEYRKDVVERVWFAGFIAPPRLSDTRTWEVTEAGLTALQSIASQPIGAAATRGSTGTPDENHD